MARLKILTLAAARRRVGSVVLDGEALIDWRISDKAAENAECAAAYVAKLIAEYQPDVVVTEEGATARHKGTHTLTIIDAMGEAAETNAPLAVTLPREHHFPNKYAEADALVEQFPELAPWKPIRLHFYDNEPRNTVLFEALAFAQCLIERHHSA